MTISKTLLAASLAAIIVLPGGATAQPAPGGEPPSQTGGGSDPEGSPEFAPGRPPAPPLGDKGPHHRPSMLWETAEKLAAAEVALGITPEQEGAWRAFATAMVSFVEAGRPERAEPGDDAPPTPPQGAPDHASPASAQERGIERFKGFLQSRKRQGEAAARISGALDGLAAVLTPEQIRIADRLLAELPHPGGPWMGPHDGPRPPHGPHP